MPTPICASIIIGTSLAPSPIESVIHVPFNFARATTSDFCLGDTRQQIIEFASTPKSKNLFAASGVSNAQIRVYPSITTALLGLVLVIESIFAYSSFFSKSYLEGDDRIIKSMISSFTRLQLLPISIAVSYFSLSTGAMRAVAASSMPNMSQISDARGSTLARP